MDIGVTHDMEVVRQLITLPEIWDRACDGDMKSEDFIPIENNTTCWLLCKIDNKIIGIILLHNDNSTTLKFHPYLMGKYHKFGREMMKVFYKWILENTPESILKINISIPECQKKVYNFAKKVGFQDEGFNRESYLKDGEIYGQYNLGITRQEMT